ncbi:MAG: threonine--tRNA ligase [Polyangiales bacterium]
MSDNAAMVLKGLSKLHPNTVAALVDGKVTDLHAPVPEGATVTPIASDDPRALPLIRHSTAHVMADAVQRLFPGTRVTIGPAIESGFYYDFDRRDGRFTEEDLARIEDAMREIVKADLPFVRSEMDREDARARLASSGENYKLEILDAIPAGEAISFYQHGAWSDLCEGPHVPSTKFLGAVKLTSVAGAYWRGDERNPMLQRIYGTAFPSQKALDAHLKQLEEAKARDHRRLGRDLQLFMFHEWAPASPFFLPRGAFVYNGLVSYIRGQYAQRGYDEVITPQVFDKALWERSGHWENYRDNMFLAFGTDAMAGDEKRGIPMGEVFPVEPGAAASSVRMDYVCGCKAMNCPSHCLMFAADLKSYRDLPLRLADFGRLHRYERSGVTHGLSRVRTFSQDDGHIFCTPEQMPGEIDAFFDLLDEVYGALGMDKVAIRLATRPKDGYLGDVESWDAAERTLAESVTRKGRAFEYAPGEGAFYGPKLEFHVTDAIGRSWQLGTIQLDFNLPERFDLSYVGSDNAPHRPVMLHRAVLGSLERFLSVYIEHTAGWFPVWLAPEQIVLVTVADRHLDFAYALAAKLKAAGLRPRVDPSSDKLTAKIRSASLMRPPYIGVIGDKELERDGVTLRKGRADLGFNSTADLIARLQTEGVAGYRAPAEG